MTSDEVDFPRPLALEYLEHIEALTAEIRAGMVTIGANALPEFQQSVSKQQDLCIKMCQLKEQVDREETFAVHRGAGSSQLYSWDPWEDSLAEKIWMAAESLRDLNTQYAALLKHSGDSIRLFAGLCQNYAGPLQQPGGMNAQRQSWSCEL